MSQDNTSGKIDEDARTVGIDIKKWNPSPEEPDSLFFSILDLAGQAIYALTHQVRTNIHRYIVCMYMKHPVTCKLHLITLTILIVLSVFPCEARNLPASLACS
jgi:hypothetical protein